MGHGFGSICIVALAIVVSPAEEVNTAQAPTPAESRRVIVGVVRGDGVLLPLASRQNEEWTTLRSFDSAGRGTFRLVDTSRIPREGWIYVPWNVGGPRPLVIRDPVTIDAHCSRQEGFGTDAPPPSVKLDAAHLMAGIALHGDVSTVRVEDVARQPDDTSRRAARFVVQLTHALEAERAAVPQKSARTTIPADGRDRVAVEITTLARDRVREAEHYYFESRKRYGTVESYANGWVASSPFSISVVSFTGGIDGGGETPRRRGRVLGVLRMGLGSVWVMEMRGYEGDSYDLVEMPPSRQTLSVHGGGC